MDAHNPYESPTTSVKQAPLPPERDIPDTITTPIRHGWITACISGVITLLAVLMAVFAGSGSSRGVQFFSLWNLIDVALIAVLAFGIYKRSRTAATIMFVYFLLSKILIAVGTGSPSGLVFGLVFMYFYFRAMIATYRYHQYIRTWRRDPPPARASLADNPAFKPAPPEADAS